MQTTYSLQSDWSEDNQIITNDYVETTSPSYQRAEDTLQQHLSLNKTCTYAQAHPRAFERVCVLLHVQQLIYA